MTKKQSPLRNRLARHVTRSSGVQTAVLRPADERRSLFEVCWDVLSRACPLEVTSPDELADRLSWQPPFSSAEATGWVAGILGGDLAYASTDPLADPKLRALEADVIAALGPDAVWYANGEHPLSAFRPSRPTYGGGPIIRATFDRVVAARANGLDLVLARADED